MTLFNELEDKAKDAMKNPAERAKIEQIAKKEGISLEAAAKKHFKKQDK